MSCARMIVLLIWFPNYGSLVICFHYLPQILVRPITQSPFLDTFITLHRNVYQVKIMCRVQLLLLFVLSYCPLIVLLCLFCIIYTLVHAINHSELSQNDVSCVRMSVPSF